MKKRIVCMVCAGTVLAAHALTLRDAQQQLLSNNLSLRAASLAVDQSNAVVQETRASLFPSLDASASYSYTTKQGTININPQILNPLSPVNEVSIPGSPQARTELGLDLSYPLFTGFARMYSIEAAQHAAEAQKESLDALKNRLSLSLGLLYLQWNLSYKQEYLRKTYVQELESQSAQVKNLFTGGVVAKARVLETEARLQSAKTDLLAASDLTDSLRREVMNFIQSGDSTMCPADTLFTFDSTSVSPVLDSARAELRALEQSSKQISLMGKALEGRHLPAIFGTAGYRYANPGLDIGTDKFMDYGVVGVQATWNLFDGFKTREQLAGLKIQREIVQNSRHDLITTFEKTLDISAAQIARASSRIDAAFLSLQSAQAYEKELFNSLEAGVSTRTDYLDAMSARVQAELTIEQAKFARRIAILNALFASGQPIRF